MGLWLSQLNSLGKYTTDSNFKTDCLQPSSHIALQELVRGGIKKYLTNLTVGL